MDEKRYSIDLHENTKPGKVLKIVMGILCLTIAIWFAYSIAGTRASVGTAWIAIVFLFLFSLWLIVTGLGYTDRYIIINENNIKLRKNILMPPVVFSPSSLSYVEFKPLRIDFAVGEKKVSVRLGAYYPDQSSAIMQAVEEYCREKGIEVRGVGSGDEDE
jgi:hypothetical protein